MYALIYYSYNFCSRNKRKTQLLPTSLNQMTDQSSTVPRQSEPVHSQSYSRSASSPRSSLSRLPSSLLGRLHDLPDFALCRLCWVYPSHEEVKKRGGRRPNASAPALSARAYGNLFQNRQCQALGAGRGQRGLVYKYVF